MLLSSRSKFITEARVKDLFTDPDENPNLLLHWDKDNISAYLEKIGYEDLAYGIETGKDSVGQGVSQEKYNTWLDEYYKIKKENK